ncbi:MAG: nitrous oxide reductase family maturation protein NosD [Flavobacteriales bacterium]|nr:nitrous oxide reductase family maturation protein NosD [Flavobacteriales bacterium]
MRPSLLAILLFCSANALNARTWTYRPAEGGTLKALIGRVAEGDTIVVHGLVDEGLVHIDKPLVLLAGKDAVIDGGGEGHVLAITADDVTVRGFTIRGTRYSSMDDLAGIFVNECRRTVIADNILDKCFFAIYLSGSRGAVVENNTVRGEPGDEDRMANGIHLWKCGDATIRHNRVEHHRDGIYFEFVTDSRIHHNTTVRNTRYGLHFMFSHRDAYEDNHFEDNGAGVAVMFSHTIEMRRNRFIANRGASAYGLLLKEINDGVIHDNLFTDNTTGIMVDGCNRIDVHNNVFRMNGWALRLFANAFDCRFTGNTFSGNTFDVSTNGSLKDNVMEGNYWDRYSGYDLDRDGHGDVPHRPLGFFTLLVERMPHALVFSRSLFVSLLDRAERLIPSLGPEALKDERPLMRPPNPTRSVTSGRQEDHHGERTTLPLVAIRAGETRLHAHG